MLRSIAELAAYGTFAVLLTAASLSPETGNAVSSATSSSRAASALGEARAPAATTSRGALLFATKGCIGCHTQASFPNARMNVGPDLTALADRAGTRVAGLDARAYVRQSIREPGAYRVAGYTALMPDLRLSDEQIDSLTAFLLSPGADTK
ncbi:MAG TPA: cytochrome c [Candidatus Limnocylindria bacterium]|nr:cytochrome c [Candidatus Limnocylindria bacterium]